MKAVMTALAALALTAGVAAAEVQQQGRQPGVPAQTEKTAPRTGQTYSTGPAGQNVGQDTQHPYTNGQAALPIPQRRGRAAASTGVAGGFVAAGVGLALLGLFVRKRTRHHPDDPHHDERR